MNILWVCKRHYTNKDLILDRFGRLFHFPIQLGNLGNSSLVIAIDYCGKRIINLEDKNALFVTLPVMNLRPLHTWSTINHYMHKSKPDIVIASGDTHLGWLGFQFAKRRGLPFVFDIYDDYRTFTTNKLPGMKRLFLYLVKKSNAIVCSSHKLALALEPHTKQIYTIGNGVDTELFHETDRLDARARLGIAANAVVVGYFGALKHELGLGTLLDACGSLKQKVPELQLLLAGHNRIGALIQRDYVDYRGSVPQSLIPQFINACNVVTLPYHRGPQVDMSNPCKLAEYMACHIPIVATRVTDLPTVLAQCPMGLCEPDDTASMVTAILNQLETPCSVKFSQEYTWASLSEKLGNVLCKLL
jgi:glycosyltransferase involved in cell wall biosynthesis